MILIYTVCKNKSEAKKIAKILLKLKLIACANWWPTESVYRWKNKTVNGREAVMYLKTRKEYYKKVEQVIKKLHSYQTPCVLEIDVDKIDRQYQAWVRQETRMV